MKRWPIIRHARWFMASHRFWKWWDDFGQHFGCHPNPADLAWLDRIWRGET